MYCCSVEQVIKDTIHTIVRTKKMRSSWHTFLYNSLYGWFRSKIVFPRFIRAQLATKDFVLTKNGFPYSELMKRLVKPEHLLIFYKESMPQITLENSTLIISNGKQTETIEGVTDFLAWENELNMNPIKEIYHLQLLIEKTT